MATGALIIYAPLPTGRPAKGNLDLFEGVLNGVVGYHLLFEDVGAGFGRFHHFDNFAECTTFAFLHGGHSFLCQIL